MEKILKQEGSFAGELEGSLVPRSVKPWQPGLTPGGRCRTMRRRPQAGKCCRGPVRRDHRQSARQGHARGHGSEVQCRGSHSHCRPRRPGSLWRHGLALGSVGNDHTSDSVRTMVTPEEVTRYGLDLMVRRPEGVEKPDFEFIFDLTQLEGRQGWRVRCRRRSAIRDTPALQDPLKLGGLLHQFVFAPEACDSLLRAAEKAGVAGLGFRRLRRNLRYGTDRLRESQGPGRYRGGGAQEGRGRDFGARQGDELVLRSTRSRLRKNA